MKQAGLVGWLSPLMPRKQKRQRPYFPLVRGLTLGLALCLLVAGCGKRLAEVNGRVTCNKLPVSGGATVLFSNNAAGTHIVATLDEDGCYQVGMAEGYGLPPARYQVSVLPPPLNLSAEFIEKQRGKSPPLLAAFPSIPLKYRDPKTSGLELHLTAEGAIFNINMVSDP